MPLTECRRENHKRVRGVNELGFRLREENSLGQFLEAPSEFPYSHRIPFPPPRRLHKSMTIKAFLQLMRLFLFITFSWLSSSIDWLGLVRFGWVPWPVVDRSHSDSALPPALSLLVTLSSLVFFASSRAAKLLFARHHRFLSLSSAEDFTASC